MTTSNGTLTCHGISVTAETNAGGRRHMEDYVAVKLAPTSSEACFNQLSYLREQAYIGVFDGHGGKEAAKCARERLWEIIQRQPKFRSSDLKCVLQSIREAFVALHEEMEPLRATWKKNELGDLSTAGTTASIVIFRQEHIIVANVGDSTAVLAVSNPRAGEDGQHPVVAKTLTIDHKPEEPYEIARIEKQGGKVMLSREGVPRVVWQRERKLPKGSDIPDGTPVMFDAIPFLNVARSLGDFWSYNQSTKEFVVSPCPDVHIHPLKPKEQEFVVIASDGLWNVMTPTQVVQFIWDYEHDDQTCHQPRNVVKAVINEALRRWKLKNLLADNIAVLIAFLSEQEIVISSSDPLSPLPSVETTTTVSPTSSDPTPAPVQNGHSSKVEYHTLTKLRHHRKGEVSSKRCFTPSSSKERTSLRKRAKTDEGCKVFSAKRIRHIDSGLDMDTVDSPTERTVTNSPLNGLSGGDDLNCVPNKLQQCRGPLIPWNP